MRVVFCVYGYGPEVERLQPWLTVHEVATVLIASGWDVHLLTDVDRRPSLDGMHHHYVRTMRPSNAPEVRAVLDAVRPDRVVVLTTPLNLAVSGWYKSVRCKLVAFLAYPFYTHRELIRALPHLRREDLVAYGRHALIPERVWSGTLRRHYSTLIAQSRRTAARVAAATGPTVEAHSVPAGLDLDFWRPGDTAAARTRAAVRFLYVGSAKAIRGFDVLLEAFRDLQGHDVELRILARGCGPGELGELRRRIDARVGGMRDRVELVGGWVEREAYRDELRAADVVVLPFVLVPSELPVSVIECIACGTPVIATDIDGLPDAVGAAGMIVQAGSAPALAAAMRVLGADPRGIEKLRRCCAEVRARMLDWRSVGREWLRVLSA